MENNSDSVIKSSLILEAFGHLFNKHATNPIFPNLLPPRVWRLVLSDF
jgi:hypothetical protein